MTRHYRADVERTRATLDALPDRAVIIDANGDAWQKYAFLDTWYRAYDGDGVDVHTMMQNVGVFEVISGGAS